MGKSERTCGECGRENAEDARFCSACRADLRGYLEEQDSLDKTPTIKPEEVEEEHSPVGDYDYPSDKISGLDSLDGAPTVTVKSGEDLGDQTGRVIVGRYEILSRVGKGGMGVVYRAKDKKLDREIALKRLIAPESGAQRGIERFLQEARAIAALNHKNIVTVHELAEDDEGPFIVMEHLEGGSLSDRIKQSGAMSVEEALDIVQPVVQALSYAHRRSIIHRDIKPANIMFNAEGEPKLVDFGLAQLARESELSMTGYGMGTATYMPPEQKRDAKRADHRSDIFSLAKTLYKMVTGETPDPVDYELIPEELRPALRHALKPKPEDRPFSVDEFLKELNSTAGRVKEKEPGELEISLGDCPQCGASNPEDVKFCRMCGAGLFEPCPKCGKEDRIGIVHCGDCGLKIPNYKEAQQALLKAKEHLENRLYDRAIKEAEGGLETGCLGKELEEIRVKAKSNIEKIREMRTRIEAYIQQEKYEDVEKLIPQVLELEPEESSEGLRSLKEKLPKMMRERDQRLAIGEIQSLISKGKYNVAVKRCNTFLAEGFENEELQELRFKVNVLLAEEKKAEAKKLLESEEYAKAASQIEETLKLNPEDSEVSDLKKKVEREWIKEKKEHASGLAEEEKYQEALRLLEEVVPYDEEARNLKNELQSEIDYYRKKVKQVVEECQRKVEKENDIKDYIERICSENINYWIKASEFEVPEADWLLGVCAEEGFVTDENPSAAADLYEKSAEASFPVAMIYLGACFQEGYGVKKNKRKSENWFSEAKNNGLDIHSGIGEKWYEVAFSSEYEVAFSSKNEKKDGFWIFIACATVFWGLLTLMLVVLLAESKEPTATRAALAVGWVIFTVLLLATSWLICRGKIKTKQQHIKPLKKIYIFILMIICPTVVTLIYIKLGAITGPQLVFGFIVGICLGAFLGAVVYGTK